MAPRRKNSSKKQNFLMKKILSYRKASFSSINTIIARALIGIVLLIVLIEAVKMSTSVQTPKSMKAREILSVSGQGKSCGPFNSWGIAAVGKDKFIVADQEHNRLLLFDVQGKFIKGWGKHGLGPMEFQEPTGMCIDDKGNAYVMDTWNGTIKGFNDKGKEILVLPLGNNGFYGPRGVFFDENNFLVADSGGHRIVTITRDGTIVASWGGYGTEKGKLRGPNAVATDQKGHYFVADTDNRRIQIFDKNGISAKIIKYDGAVWAVAVDREGRFYVPNMDQNGCIKVYDATGKYIATLTDENGTLVEPFRGLSISPNDVLMGVSGDTAVLFQLPANNP